MFTRAAFCSFAASSPPTSGKNKCHNRGDILYKGLNYETVFKTAENWSLQLKNFVKIVVWRLDLCSVVCCFSASALYRMLDHRFDYCALWRHNQTSAANRRERPISDWCTQQFRKYLNTPPSRSRSRYGEAESPIVTSQAIAPFSPLAGTRSLRACLLQQSQRHKLVGRARQSSQSVVQIFKNVYRFLCFFAEQARNFED